MTEKEKRKLIKNYKISFTDSRRNEYRCARNLYIASSTFGLLISGCSLYAYNSSNNPFIMSYGAVYAIIAGLSIHETIKNQKESNKIDAERNRKIENCIQKIEEIYEQAEELTKTYKLK